MSEQIGNAPSKTKKNLLPLIEWYRANKPEVKTITVAQDDYDRLLNSQQKTLARNGFALVRGEISYGDYMLRRKP